MENIDIKGKSLFLAGPIPRDENAISWKKEAIDILEKYGFSGTVLIPEKRVFVAKSNYMEEVDWDLKALSLCDLIVFWIPRKKPYMLGLTSNVEFGYYINKKNILYGRPDDADEISYLDWLYKKDTGKLPFNSLEKLLVESIKILK